MRTLDLGSRIDSMQLCVFNLHIKETISFLSNSFFFIQGNLWRHYYGKDGPRPPPVLHMWAADKIGQKHQVESSEGFW